MIAFIFSLLVTLLSSQVALEGPRPKNLGLLIDALGYMTKEVSGSLDMTPEQKKEFATLRVRMHNWQTGEGELTEMIREFRVLGQRGQQAYMIANEQEIADLNKEIRDGIKAILTANQSKKYWQILTQRMLTAGCFEQAASLHEIKWSDEDVATINKHFKSQAKANVDDPFMLRWQRTREVIAKWIPEEKFDSLSGELLVRDSLHSNDFLDALKRVWVRRDVPSNLISRIKIHLELKLSPDQIEKLRTIQDELEHEFYSLESSLSGNDEKSVRKAYEDLFKLDEKATRKIEPILSDEQNLRFEELLFQTYVVTGDWRHVFRVAEVLMTKGQMKTLREKYKSDVCMTLPYELLASKKLAAYRVFEDLVGRNKAKHLCGQLYLRDRRGEIPFYKESQKQKLAVEKRMQEEAGQSVSSDGNVRRRAN